MKTHHRPQESGNVLFLILIAVILFAALSYAVMNSSRTTEDGPGKTIDSLHAAAIAQYPTGLRLAIMRMVIGGMSMDALAFNPPSDFGSLPSDKNGVFHPNGGAATWQTAPPDDMESGAQGSWHFNTEFEVENISLSAASDFAGNDLVAFLPGIRPGICTSINERAGISSIPNSSADLSGDYTIDMDDSYALPGDEAILGVAGSNGTDDLTGQPFGCFRNSNGEYVYYHVLMER